MKREYTTPQVKEIRVQMQRPMFAGSFLKSSGEGEDNDLAKDDTDDFDW